MPTATLTSKGQLTLTIELREKIGLHSGSRIGFVQNNEGSWLILPKTGDIRELKGIVKYDGPPVSIEDMEAAVIKGAIDEYFESIK